MNFKNLTFAALLLSSMSLYAKDNEGFELTRRSEDELAKIYEASREEFYEDDGIEEFKAIAEDKKTFKRRASPYNSVHTLAMSIETNFQVPFVGSQNYFGRIYLLTHDTSKIDYRDEQIANKRYKEEVKNPRDFYTQKYAVSKINSKAGLDLVNAAGAVVNLRSGNFSTKKGGRLYLKVKAPQTAEMNIVMDVVVNGRSVQNYVVEGSQKHAFTSFTIHASKTLMTGTSILNGIDRIQFDQNGRSTYSIEP